MDISKNQYRSTGGKAFCRNLEGDIAAPSPPIPTALFLLIVL